MGKGAERRALRRQKRQDARDARRAARSGAKTERQKNRQGFLSGIIGDDGLGGLADKFGFAGDDLDAGGGKSGEDSEDSNNMMMYALIGLGAYMLMQKK